MFVEGCTDAKGMVGDANEPTLAMMIKGKLIGDARKAVTGMSPTTVEGLLNKIKKAFVPSTTVMELTGIMVNECQRGSESVLQFANRIKDLQQRMIEAERVSHGTVSNDFKANLEANAIACFRKGLNPEIERRLDKKAELAEVVDDAIQAERLYDEQDRLWKIYSPRRKDENDYSKIDGRDQKSVRFTIKRCQMCGMNNHEAMDCRLCSKNKRFMVCQLCDRDGHAANECEIENLSVMVCQLCNQDGHLAVDCKTREDLVSCQLCGKAGHTAKGCPSKLSPRPPPVVCQICNKPYHTAANCFLLMGNPSEDKNRDQD